MGGASAQEFRPAPPRSEICVVLVEGPENAQTENVVTIRSKPVSRTFFEEAAEQIDSIDRLIEEAEKILIGFDKGRNYDDYEKNDGEARKPPDRDKNYSSKENEFPTSEDHLTIQHIEIQIQDSKLPKF